MEPIKKQVYKVFAFMSMYIIIPFFVTLTWWKLVLLGAVITVFIKDDLESVYEYYFDKWKARKEKKEAEDAD